jgi:sterol 3beta-glucosyltransferase
LAALGLGLQRQGHQVRLVAGDEFAGLVTGAGLAFVSLGIEVGAASRGYRDLYLFMASIKDQVAAASQGKSDAIVATFLGIGACPLARARGIPFFYALPMPGLRTAEFPHPLFPSLPLGKFYNALTYRLVDHRATRSFADARCLFGEPRPTYLFCFSPHVVPRPADWANYAHVTGYWFLDHPVDWHPPEGLVEFLQGRPPPVYVGFGSVPADDAQRLTSVALEALAYAEQRGVLVTGQGDLQDGEITPDLYLASAIPHDWLFPRVAAAVHHGGAGTTAAALRAGIPSVIVPFGLDQSFWARRLQGLGAGTEPLDSKRLTAEQLATAIRRAVDDTQLRTSAAELGDKVRAEDGVGNAIAVIERVVAAG